MSRIAKYGIIIIPVLIILIIIMWVQKAPTKQNVPTNLTKESDSVWWGATSESETSDVSIPSNYIKVPNTDNLYMVVDDNNKITEYVLRKIEDDGSSSWQLFNKNVSSIMQHIEGNIYKYTNDDEILYFEYVEKDDGTYDLKLKEDYVEDNKTTTKHESIRETKKENGFFVVYETIIYKTYNSAGELINTRTEGPNVISKTKDIEADDVKMSWLQDEYTKYCSKTDWEYSNDIENHLFGLINSMRSNYGYTEFVEDNEGLEKLISKVAGGNLLSNDFDYDSDFFKQLEKYYKDYNIITLTVPLDIEETDVKIAECINNEIKKNDYSNSILLSAVYQKLGISVIKTEKGYLVVEIFNK